MEFFLPQLREEKRLEIDDRGRDDPDLIKILYRSAKDEAINEPSEKEYLNAILQKTITKTNIVRESHRFLLVIMVELAVIIYALLK